MGDFAQNSAEAGRAFCSDLRRFPRSTRPVSCWLAMRNACYSVPISGRADKCFDDLHGGQGHFHRDPRQETYNPNAERFSQHAKLCSDLSVHPVADMYPHMNKEQWKRASSEWNKGLHYDGTKGAPRRSAQSRKEKGLSKAQRLAKVWSSAKTTESFLRTPDMREQKADPELKASEQAARSRQSKRCHSAPPRRLMFFTKTRSKPLDSKGGCFSAPLGVDNWGPASSGINTGTTINQWNQTKASVSAGYNVAPSEKSLVPHLSTVYPYCGEAPRGPASRSELNGKKQKPTAMRYTQQQPIPSRFCYY